MKLMTMPCRTHATTPSLPFHLYTLLYNSDTRAIVSMLLGNTNNRTTCTALVTEAFLQATLTFNQGAGLPTAAAAVVEVLVELRHGVVRVG
jgi:hypothetical protein